MLAALGGLALLAFACGSPSSHMSGPPSSPSSLPSPSAAGFPNDGVGPSSTFCQVFHTDYSSIGSQIPSIEASAQPIPETGQRAVYSDAQVSQLMVGMMNDLLAVAPTDLRPYLVRDRDTAVALSAQMMKWENSAQKGSAWPTAQQVRDTVQHLDKPTATAGDVLSAYESVHCSTPTSSGQSTSTRAPVPNSKPAGH